MTFATAILKGVSESRSLAQRQADLLTDRTDQNVRHLGQPRAGFGIDPEACCDEMD